MYINQRSYLMNKNSILNTYISHCHNNLIENDRILSLLKNMGIFERFIVDNFQLGYADGNLENMIQENISLKQELTEIGLLNNNKDCFANYIIIPILDENKAIVNIAGYSPYPQTKNKVIFLNAKGIFNCSFLAKSKKIYFTESPIDCLLLIQNDYANSTFIMGDEKKYISFLSENKIHKACFTFQGKAKLFYEMTMNGITCQRFNLDFNNLKNGNARQYLEKMFSAENKVSEKSDDTIMKIEKGFLFQFPHLNYRVIGNFNEYSLTMKANIKAYKDKDVFVDSIDLYKNRDRNNYVFNLMDKFQFRDQVQLEQDMSQIIEVIEKHKQKKENEKKKEKPELTDHQKQIGLKFLKNPNLIDEIDNDLTRLGYVRERKNKILLYLIMTSRLTVSPLSGIIISRSSAGKSVILDLIERLCPEEELVSISDLSSNAMFYFGENDLKHKFVVIGEKVGSESSEYPIRELISKKSISKAIPIKDAVTSEIKTQMRKVNGPVAYCETGTSQVNEENLTRYFICSIDESELQTRLIHEQQRFDATFEGFLKSLDLDKITQKHVYAQRLLKPVYVFNPFAPKLKFPANKLKTRRDHQKFMRLIMVICFLHQYQRKVKKHKLSKNKIIEYIECTHYDYKVAYELLKDGILDNTLDDIPRGAKELMNLIKKYLKKQSQKDKLPQEKLIFSRKQIREYTGWSFVQIRNNFRMLKDYEYIELINNRKGQAHQYKLAPDYKDTDIHNQILSPEELENI